MTVIIALRILLRVPPALKYLVRIWEVAAISLLPDSGRVTSYPEVIGQHPNCQSPGRLLHGAAELRTGAIAARYEVLGGISSRQFLQVRMPTFSSVSSTIETTKPL